MVQCERKQEALKRLHMLNLHPNVLRDYCYPGAVDYITGIYEGCGNWNTVYDNGNNPEFKVLYWRDIEEIKGIENEMM